MFGVAVILLSSFVINAQCSRALFSGRRDGCTKLPKMCKKIIPDKYTHMRLPNMLNHSRFEDVKADLKAWKPLLNSTVCNSKNQLKYFLCFTYAPICVGKRLISPCRSFCETVRCSCDPVMRIFNYTWPSFFDCSDETKFKNDSSRMCIKGEKLGLKIDFSCDLKKKWRSHICKTDFVISAWIVGRDRRRRAITVKTSRIFRQTSSVKDPLKRKSTSTLVLPKGCKCHKIRLKPRGRGSGRYLIMGKFANGRLRVKVLTKMPKRHQQIRKIARQC